MFDRVPDVENHYYTNDSFAEKNQFSSPLISRFKFNEINSIVSTLKPDLIIFHSLFPQNLFVLNELNTSTPICWFSWGGDISLDYKSIFREGHEEITFKNYFQPTKLKLFKHDFWNVVKNTIPFIYSKYYQFRTKELWSNFMLNKNFHKVKIINTVTTIERELFLKHNFKGEFVHIPIGTIAYLSEGIQVEKDPSSPRVNNVFIGHSAFALNNQLDIFHELDKLHFAGEVICPLSYGDKDYAELVSNSGYTLFKDRFHPIKDYLTKEDYFAKLCTSDLYINNSIIQQGLGNILIAIYFDIPVVLNEKGTIFKYFKEHQIFCYSIQKDLKQLLQGIPSDFKEKVSKNKKIIDSIYSENTVTERIKDLMHLVK